MFLVLNKEKILSYTIAVFSVAMLFVIAFGIYTPNNNETAIVSTNLSTNNSSDSTKNKNTFTINSTWNDEDINLVLDILHKHNCKLTFFIDENWAAKYPNTIKKISNAGHKIEFLDYNSSSNE